MQTHAKEMMVFPFARIYHFMKLLNLSRLKKGVYI
jgi:hypothetical protein